VAITSSDGGHIDLHFGKAREFHIVELDVDKGEWISREIRAIAAASADIGGIDGFEGEYGGGCTGSRDQLLRGIGDLLADCRYLLTRKIGIRPYKFLMQRGISSLESPLEISDALGKLAVYLRKKNITEREPVHGKAVVPGFL
jgi:predicted Fe-Mo cluster-binding NifX family protein